MHSFALALALPALARAANYTIKTNSTGSAFFDAWNFVSGVDVTNVGNVLFQAQQDAQAQGLAVVNSAGNVILKVDNTTTPADPSTFGRPSVYLTSKDAFNHGELMLFDAVHMPFGCGVWPAYWTLGGGTWPSQGEIDIIEGVNQQVNNQYSLHTTQGCQHPATTQGETGSLVQADCFNATNFNSGCLVKENTPNNYGSGFAQNGGGVYATLWDNDGIKMWFFPRPSIPSDVAGSSPDPSGWGNPSAFYPTSTCDTSKFFGPQTIQLEIDLCGNFAGLPAVFNATCPGVGACTDLIKTASNFNDAFFEIKYHRVFSQGSTSPTPTGSSASSTGSPTPSSKPNGAAPVSASWRFVARVASASTIVALFISRHALV